MLRARCWSSLLVLALACAPAVAQAQFRGVRFEITQVNDTTFRFPRGTASWVKPKMTGFAVDPSRRDVLVARFRVARVDSGMVTAVITGMATRVATEHIAVLTEPPRPWYRQITFYGGVVIGFIAGIAAIR